MYERYLFSFNSLICITEWRFFFPNGAGISRTLQARISVRSKRSVQLVWVSKVNFASDTVSVPRWYITLVHLFMPGDGHTLTVPKVGTVPLYY